MSPYTIVAGLAIVAFVVAVLVFRAGGSTTSSQNQSVSTSSQATTGAAAQGSPCDLGTSDSSYTVTMDSNPNPPAAEGTTFHLTVRHNGQAVTGAKVCISADMTEMHHEGITNFATEAGAGKYDTTLTFGMRGPYKASVTIIEPGKAAVSVPITFPVN